MKRWALQVVLLSLAVVSLGCAPRPPSFVKPGSLPVGTAITLYGVDFTRTVFADRHFTYERLMGELLPNWNRDLTVAMRDEVDGHPIGVDLGSSAARNGWLGPAAMVQIPAPAYRLPAPAQISAEIAPYAQVHRQGIGMVLFVDQIAKEEGVFGHYVVFDAATGEVLVVGQAAARGDGWGLYAYYFNPLRKIAISAASAVAAAHPR